MAGGCGAAGTGLGMGCPWKTCKRIIDHEQEKKCLLINSPSALSEAGKKVRKGKKGKETLKTRNHLFKDIQSKVYISYMI